MARLAVFASPKSAADGVQGWRGSELVVRVTAAPEGGKANAAVCAIIAKRLGVAKTSVRVVRGESARHKVLEIDGVQDEDVRATFGESDAALF